MGIRNDRCIFKITVENKGKCSAFVNLVILGYGMKEQFVNMVTLDQGWQQDVRVSLTNSWKAALAQGP